MLEYGHMNKDEFHTHEELTVAAAGYLPPFWAVLLLFRRWRLNYFTRYHLIHAGLLSVFNILSILAIGLLTMFIARFSGYHFWLTLLTGHLIALTLLLTAGLIAWCALNAARGRYTVIPGLSQIYYALFSQPPNSSPAALIRHHQRLKKTTRTHAFQPMPGKEEK